ncbi:hypothetical protein PR048_009672 [Dryococelus australis]|uniref:Uncharacterized protein n=1 Tax=Dryococelus australis TaxID=614101 RepID=A0ABQ9I0J1_9NEOP|nr:hypothetical protein PR048_009672 [Dryococelus australis]
MKDKEAAASKSCQVFSVDVQAVKLKPVVRASAVHLKKKICCHNYTVYNLTSHLKCIIFTSLLVEQVEKVIKHWPSEIPRVIVIWNDGCCYQNKRKYFLVGHTQIEVDSVHALIERKLYNREMYLPSDYVSVTKEAKMQ